jgi:hypothetical protein
MANHRTKRPKKPPKVKTEPASSITRKSAQKPQFRMTEILKPQTLNPADFITKALGIIDETKEIKSTFAIDTLSINVKFNVSKLFRHKFEPNSTGTELVREEETDDIENDIRSAVCFMLSGSCPHTLQRCSSTLIAMDTLWQCYREIITEQYNLTSFHEVYLDQLGKQFMDIVKPMEFGEVTCDALFHSFSDFLNPKSSLTREEASFRLSTLYGNYYFIHDHSVPVGKLVMRCLLCPYWENRLRRARGIGV